MNADNEEYLKRQVYYLGFGENLNTELSKKMKEGREKFEIPFTAEFNKGDKKQVVEYTINFGKSKQNDMYFLNNYQATLKDQNPEKDKTQTFYINKSNNVTAKEAYNLLDGRAVHKKMENREGEPYEAWLQLENKKQDNGNHAVKQYHTAWGFDLDKNISKIPMKELENAEQKDKLMKSLEKGNLQSVTLVLAGKEEKAFLEANPKDRNVILYDAAMTKQNQGVREHKTESVGQQEGKREGKSEAVSKEQKAEPDPEKKTRGRKMSV